MNYQKLYDQIIYAAQERCSEKGPGIESHHVVMRSMGGSNDSDNIVELTYREHYLCHWLLYKIHRNSEAAFAWRAMSLRLHRRTVTARLYSECKKAWSFHMSKINKGVKKSPEARMKMSAAKKGKPTWNKGLIGGQPEESLREIYEKSPRYCRRCNGKVPFEKRMNTMFCSIECKKNAPKVQPSDDPHKGRFYRGMEMSEDVRSKISGTLKGTKRPRGNCPHCGKEGAISLLKRWHYDNCKEK